MVSLIINADDLGLTPAVSRGIFESITNGVVSRTSAMMCSENSYLIKKYLKDLDGKIGLHLQLTDGTSKLDRSQIPSLVDEDGLFPKKSNLLGHLNKEEIELEWNAQMNAFLELGIQPSHLDTHHNVHRFPKAFKAICSIAQKYNLPVRPLSKIMAQKLESLGILQCCICLESWPNKEVTTSSLVTYLVNFIKSHELLDKPVELMCHPGFVDKDLIKRSNYLDKRKLELEVFLDPELPKLLKSYNINLL